MRRGEVRRFAPSGRVGHEQRGERFAVIVQADALLPRSTVLVAPTSASARAASFRPPITIGNHETRVLVEQLGAVDVQRLGRKVAQLSADDLWAVDDALATVLGLL